jgi:hypothetical protein
MEAIDRATDSGRQRNSIPGNQSASPNLAIADFSLFRVLKQKLHGIGVSDDEQVKSEILTIFQGIPSDELKKSFAHWIERCHGLPQMQGPIAHHSHKI